MQAAATLPSIPSRWRGPRSPTRPSQVMNTDTQRVFLVVALGLVVLMLWTAWQQDYGARPAPSPAAEAPAAAPGTAQEPSPPAAEDLPELPATARLAEPQAGAMPQLTEPVGGTKIEVYTDVYEIQIDTQGGIIHSVRLLDYPVAVERPEEPFLLINADSPVESSQVQGGVVSRAGPEAPNHTTDYRSPGHSYRLQEGQEELRVPLYWDGGAGLRVEKTLVFRRGSYLIDVLYQVHNDGDVPWQGRAYAQLQRAYSPPAGGFLGSLFTQPVYSYTGAVLSSPDDRYTKYSFEDMRERRLERDIKDGWIAYLQHYFISALLPQDAEREYYYYSLVPGNGLYTAGSMAPGVRLAPGETAQTGHRVYLGPKIQDTLSELAPKLELTVDYGWLWPISKFLFFLLSWLHGLTGNWGIAIILLTALVKLAFYHLSAKSYRSMAHMRKLQPNLQNIRDRYKDDKAGMQQAMMKLYREEKFNPFSGCLPILVQIPVFIALYWVLLESVELRQADFMLWLNDLSSRDPYFVLPLLMGITMYVQQRLSPQSPDPMQRRIMTIFPPLFTVIVAFFPAGLVLYWLVNNLLSIAQQWLIMYRIEKQSNASA